MLVSALVSDPPIGFQTLRHGQGRIALSLCFTNLRVNTMKFEAVLRTDRGKGASRRLRNTGYIQRSFTVVKLIQFLSH